MTIRDLIRDYVLADATVTSLIGTRMYPDQLPAKVTFPAAVILSVDIVRPNPLRSVATLASARMQVDVYAQPTSGLSSRALADAAGTAIRQRIDGQALMLSDTSVSPAVDVTAWVRFDLETENAEPDLHGGLSRHTADYLIHYQTQSGAY